MWGDPERAASLQGNDPLALLLFQIASPAHVPWGDSRWQELLLGYDVWVHIEENSNASPILTRACESMAKHAAVSSNLAGLCLHVTRMLRQLVRELQKSAPVPVPNNSNNNVNNKDPTSAATSAFSSRISRVGKARATAGAMRLLRLLAHPVVVRSSSSSTDYSRSYLEDAMLYRTRGDLPADQPTARPLVYSILDLIVVAGRPDCDALETPEIYDTVVLAFHLLFVLCGTQLYQPFLSSFQIPADITGIHCVLEELFQEELSMEEMETRTYKLLDVSLSSNFSNHTSGVPKRKRRRHVWTPRDVLEVCMDWQIRRPPAPQQSITFYLQSIAETAVASSPNEKRGPDGLFESHTVVQATTPKQFVEGGSSVSQLPLTTTSGVSQAIAPHRSSGGPQMILDATKGVLMLGSTIMLLPIRLMQAVYHVLVPREKRSSTSSSLRTFQSATSRTKDVLWLSDSPIADLSCSMMLLLVNNCRNRNNPFRTQLVGMVDNRWEHESSADLFDKSIKESSDDGDKDDESIGMEDIVQADLPGSMRHQHHHHPETHFTLNFEGLFVALGRTLHTEVGALFLYTLYQASPNFAQSLAVRSDLDTLVLPLLRTLYFASNTQSYTASEFVSYARKDKGRDIRNCPFRSHSQLYVNVILLLLFSQDTSFGRDAFERIQVPMVVWYKERHLRKINLGSVLLLTLLRTLVFHMDRMPDAFLLSNCCAILQNLSPAVVDLHEYAALRLVAVTVSILKKHARVAQRATTAAAAAAATTSTTGESTEESQRQDDRSATSVEMYEEIARSLLRLIHYCVLPKHLERNIHLVYMLVYHQSDVLKLLKHNDDSNSPALYPRKLVERIVWVTEEASTILMDAGARSTTKALKALEDQIERLLLVDNTTTTKKRKSHMDGGGSGGGNNEFTFSYQEEADPEIFFVPYVWETIVCVVTASAIEWQTNDIQAFALLDEPEPIAEEEKPTNAEEGSNGTSKAYQRDAENMV